MRVVVATDLSEASLAAVDLMTSCAPVAFERVALVHAVDLDLYTGGGTVPALLDLAEERLGKITADLRDAGFDVAVYAQTGPALDVIEHIAAEEGAGLVVATNLGRGAIVGRLFGSTAERLATQARLPVLIESVHEREGAWCRIGDGTPFSRVLVATDLSESLPEQLRVVGELPGVGEVRVVYVADPHMDASVAHERLALLAAGCLPDCPAETDVIVGNDPAEAVLSEAAEWGATAIAVSPRRHGVVHRALWGSTARTIAKESTVPVLFVPTGDGR